jgi:hypothetical protein
MSDRRGSLPVQSALHGVGVLLLACSGLVACTAVDVSVGAYRPDAAQPSAHDAAAPARDTEPAPALDAGSDAPDVHAALYLEAESALLSGGFSVADDVSASAAQLLAAPAMVDAAADLAPGASRARYKFELPRAGDYVIWGRIRAPDALHNRFWFSVDGAPFRKWRISVGDIWYWDDLHDDADYGNALHFALAAGPHELVLADAVSGVELDRLYLTAEGDRPPGNDTSCTPPHSIEVKGECLPSCGAQRGRTCGAQACSGKTLIAAYDCDVCCLGP